MSRTGVPCYAHICLVLNSMPRSYLCIAFQTSSRTGVSHSRPRHAPGSCIPEHVTRRGLAFQTTSRAGVSHSKARHAPGSCIPDHVTHRGLAFQSTSRTGVLHSRPRHAPGSRVPVCLHDLRYPTMLSSLIIVVIRTPLLRKFSGRFQK